VVVFGVDVVVDGVDQLRTYWWVGRCDGLPNAVQSAVTKNAAVNAVVDVFEIVVLEPLFL